MSGEERGSDRARTGVDLILGGLPYVTLLGCAGMATDIMLSFEEPNTEILVASALLVAVAPVGLALHLAFTSELTTERRRLWVAGLMSRRGPDLFADYFSATARRKATQELTVNDRGQ